MDILTGIIISIITVGITSVFLYKKVPKKYKVFFTINNTRVYWIEKEYKNNDEMSYDIDMLTEIALNNKFSDMGVDGIGLEDISTRDVEFWVSTENLIEK